MNCQANCTQDKLHGSLLPTPKKDPSVALGTPSVTLKFHEYGDEYTILLTEKHFLPWSTEFESKL